MNPDQLRATIERTRASIAVAGALDRPWLVCQLIDLYAVSRDTEPMPVVGGTVSSALRERLAPVPSANVNPNLCPKCGNVWEACTCPPQPPGSPDRAPYRVVLPRAARAAS
jgi:hypothetical protein